MLYAMRRTTIFLDTATLRRAQARARSQGVSFAALVREALAAYIAGPLTPARKLPAIAGQFASGHHDTSERVDDLLAREPHH